MVVVRSVFKRNRGASARFARRMNVAYNTVTMFLDGEFKSARLSVAVQKFARKLLEKEGKTSAAA